MTSVARNARMSSVPTMAEGGVKDTTLVVTLMLFAPKGTPAAIVNTVNESARAVFRSPDFHAKNYDAIGTTAYPNSNPADLREYIARDQEVQGARIRTFGIKVE